MAESTKKTLTLPKAVFAVEVPNHELLKVAYQAYLANGRGNYARTLKRGEVSGGGKKPWRQKGTGRARFGSTRNPIWRKGGVAFGPTGKENYTKDLPVTAKRVAIRQALTLAAQAGKIVVIDTFACPEGKVAETKTLLAKYKVDATETTLIAVSKKSQLVERATRNLPYVKATQASYLNVFDILNADKILISKKALTIVEEWLGA